MVTGSTIAVFSALTHPGLGGHPRSKGEILHSHRREVVNSAVAFRPVGESPGGPSPSLRLYDLDPTSIGYPIPYQEVNDALVTPLRFSDRGTAPYSDFGHAPDSDFSPTLDSDLGPVFDSDPSCSRLCFCSPPYVWFRFRFRLRFDQYKSHSTLFEDDEFFLRMKEFLESVIAQMCR
ncbi:hypothetical protein EVAR_51924_1 [Eumeta japonica]|uniref:Uncharacterized protein n=1 Tax=Eumeta variegata TaxID=151549 RepID=A0A4C1XGY1_EUMVA|nr:hypothetical protein EVAR_51924_1 [Eumeta japonica]